ncbi:MAG: cytochrome c biogenesis protein CcsA [Deltaproteobacteria bacterium]|jgi:cytochrome c-type biogenesis protein CcmF|nr:cytochrome c biogenesis protein CcsA [Deltaproteobacteria bacterium]
MYLLAYLLLVAAFLAAIFFTAAAAVQIWHRETTFLPWVEKGSYAITGLMTASSMILLAAFVNNDFTVEYVARYSDNYLHIFYRLTAFWAGQEGSLLFWGWSVAIFGVFFLLSGAYASLSSQTKLWFWMFFLAVLAFFLLLLTGWSNPFITFDNQPADGNGLNPLLQNPGMIFHPPLLFLGYGGFVIPGCLALAQTLSQQTENEGLWSEVSRPFTLIAWILLSAGIILGAWWAYMELGWGGYWAWDPVENASLIPWLIATAFLHTSVVELRRGMFKRLNVLLMTLTTISAFVATYIVRGGAIQSLHAYPDGGVGGPLLIFILAFLVIALAVALFSKINSRPIVDFGNREGLLLLVACMLLLLGTIILTATLWPLISQIWSGQSSGLLPEFYNRVCLPVFTLIAVLLVFCPWTKWGGTKNAAQADEAKTDMVRTSASGIFSRPKLVLGLACLFGLGLPFFWYVMEAGPDGLSGLFSAPPRFLAAQMAASAAITGLIGLVLYFALNKPMLKVRSSLAAHCTHAGLLLMVLGVAFSGPYQTDETLVLRIGENKQINVYNVTLEDIFKGEGPGYSFLEAKLGLQKNGVDHGVLAAERRAYFKYPQPFAEAATIFSLGDEAYASLLAVDEARGMAQLRLTINPLVNWVWIGGVILCLFPLLGMFRKMRKASATSDAD